MSIPDIKVNLSGSEISQSAGSQLSFVRSLLRGPLLSPPLSVSIMAKDYKAGVSEDVIRVCNGLRILIPYALIKEGNVNLFAVFRPDESPSIAQACPGFDSIINLIEHWFYCPHAGRLRAFRSRTSRAPHRCSGGYHKRVSYETPKRKSIGCCNDQFDSN